MKWWKLWASALTDPKLLALTPAERWAWAALGAYTVVHGSKGVLTVRTHDGEKPTDAGLQLALSLGTPIDDLWRVVARLPNVMLFGSVTTPKSETLRYGLGDAPNDNGVLRVTWSNWNRYQRDSTGYERLKKWRKRRNDNGTRGEETKRRKEELLTTPLKPPKRGASCSECATVIAELNRLTGRKYQGLGQGGSMLHVRHQEAGVSACLEVVRKMTARWLEHPKMTAFLRPETLFRPGKFDSYLNEPDGGGGRLPGLDD